MFFRYLLDVLLARWRIVLIATLSALAGGTVIAFTAPPRYQATARVELGYIKPNPVTGAFLSSRMVDSYLASQMRVVRDYQVAVPAADALGLLDDPNLQSAFAALPEAATSDFSQWVARQIIASTAVRPVQDSNILEIIYVTSTPEQAREVVDAIRAAYVRSDLDIRRAGARAAVEGLTAEAAVQTQAIERLEVAKAAVQQRTGVLPFVEERRLADLVTTTAPTMVYAGEAPPSAPALAAAELRFTNAAQTLGPSHPALVALRISRDRLRSQVEQEKAFAASMGNATGAVSRARESVIDAQREKVLGQRQTHVELRLIQEQIDRRRETLNEISTQIGSMRLLTSLHDAGLTPMGDAEANPVPVFPNHWLILGGSTVLGGAIGVLLALFAELLARSVRNTRDLEASVGAPVLGVVPSLVGPRRRGSGFGLRRRKAGPRLAGKKAAA